MLKKRPSPSRKTRGDRPSVNIDAHIAIIKRHEAEHGSELGRLIHGFEYGDFTLRLDRDVTGMYRVVVYLGQDRWYSFSIRCDHRDYEALHSAYDDIIAFLSGDRRLAELPNSEGLKGHYFGPGGR